MLSNEHREAQELADAADVALWRGDFSSADQYYIEAAVLEELAFVQTRPDQIRTWGILGVSLAALYYRSEQYDKARQTAALMLAEPRITAGTRWQLVEIMTALPTSTTSDESLRHRQYPTVDESTAEGKTADEVEKLYSSFEELLAFVLIHKFRVPAGDVEGLIQEVFLSYLQTSEPIENRRGWMSVAVCNAARHYWLARNRVDELQQRGSGQWLSRDIKSALKRVLEELDGPAHYAFELYYSRGYTAIEVANELDLEAGAAEELINLARERAEHALNESPREPIN